MWGVAPSQRCGRGGRPVCPAPQPSSCLPQTGALGPGGHRPGPGGALRAGTSLWVCVYPPPRPPGPSVTAEHSGTSCRHWPARTWGRPASSQGRLRPLQGRPAAGPPAFRGRGAGLPPTPTRRLVTSQNALPPACRWALRHGYAAPVRGERRGALAAAASRLSGRWGRQGAALGPPGGGGLGPGPGRSQPHGAGGMTEGGPCLALGGAVGVLSPQGVRRRDPAGARRGPSRAVGAEPASGEGPAPRSSAEQGKEAPSAPPPPGCEE